MAELNFSVSDRLVIDGKGLAIDMATDWNSVALTTAIGVKVDKDNKNNKVHPFAEGDTFLGILSAKNVKSDIDVAGVNSIEVASLVDGFFYWVINGGDDAVVFNNKVKVTKNGFEKATDADDAVATVIIGGAKGEAIKIRGGK